MEKHKKVDEEEKLIVKEMLKDSTKHFNNEYQHCANQHLICCEDVFRGLIAKDWVMYNCNSANFHPYDKVLIKNCVKHYHECWKRR